MKRKFLGLVLGAFLFASCGTTTQTSTSANNAYDVPAGIQTSFTAQYPTATAVTWSAYDYNTVPVDWDLTGWTVMDNSDYVARFNMNGQDYYALYDAGGEWIGSYYVMANTSNLPSAINSLLNTQFTGYTIDKVQREFWKDRNAYEIKLKRGDDDKVKLLVDENGTILKQKNKD